MTTGIELVRLRNFFYQTNYRRLVKITLVLLTTLAITTGVLVYRLVKVPPPKYFLINTQGQVLQIVPLNVPYQSEAGVKNFAQAAATAAYGFDFANYRTQLQNTTRPYFSRVGWQQFMKTLTASRNMDAVKTRKLVVSAQVLSKPQIKQQGLLANQYYAWQVTLDLLVTFENEKQRFQQKLAVTMLVRRISILANTTGVAIDQFVAKQIS